MNAWIIATGIAFAVSFAIMLYYNKVFWFKLSTVTLLFAMANMIYFSFDSMKGWPSDQKIAKGELIFVHIVEPTETYKGAIYVYVREEMTEREWYDKYISYFYWDGNAPRSYFIPYTKRTSKEMREAKDAMEKGYIVEITGESAETQGNGQDNTDANNSNGTDTYQPDAGINENYKVPHLKLIDPRERSGKAQQ